MFKRRIKRKINPLDIANSIKNEKYPFFLDSGMDKESLGRYSILGHSPFLSIKAKNGVVELTSFCEEEVSGVIESDPFLELDKIMTKYAAVGTSPTKEGLPFYGGAVGYLSYDLKNYVEKLPQNAKDDADIPDLYMNIYDGGVVIDNLYGHVYVVDSGVREDHDIRLDQWESFLYDIKHDKALDEADNILFAIDEDDVEWESNLTKEEHINAVSRVKEYIRTGDVYQINMTQRFLSKLKFKPFDLYKRLRNINPAPFSAYLDYGDFQIASSSPERFLQVRSGVVETRPIKGTRPRGRNSLEDYENKLELINSDKDKSELLMIVDLERNDLSKVAKDGSVKVPELFVIEEYPTVFHLVSTVTAEIDESYSTVDCIKNAFPGGSITGAPKIRAMEIIDELEPTTRNIYTGSIGYIGFDGNADLNIVIRTILMKDGMARFQTGGGIVWDSVEEKEYEETFHKARALMDALDMKTDFITFKL